MLSRGFHAKRAFTVTHGSGFVIASPFKPRINIIAPVFAQLSFHSRLDCLAVIELSWTVDLQPYTLPLLGLVNSIIVHFTSGPSGTSSAPVFILPLVKLPAAHLGLRPSPSTWH